MNDKQILTLIDNVEWWFVDRGLNTFDGKAQLGKLKEEVDELVDARLKDDREEEIDAVGDILVVLIGYCMQRNLDIFECLQVAYDVIKDRKGKVNEQGIFVKE